MKESIEQTFGYKPFYLEAKQGDQICGVLPLFLTGGFLTGRRLISSPFAVYGGILADSGQARSLLLERAKQLAADLEVRDLELRNAWEDQCSELPRLSRYVTFTQQIRLEEETILNTIPRKTRAAVRKSLQQRLVSRREFSDTRAFEDLYSRNLRRLGTPCFPKSHFRTLLEKFRGISDIRGLAERKSGRGRVQLLFPRTGDSLLRRVGSPIQCRSTEQFHVLRPDAMDRHQPCLPSRSIRPLKGCTVAQVLALANQVLGGNVGALPAGLTVSGLNDVVDNINQSFDNGSSTGYVK